MTTEELRERQSEYWRRVAESDGFDVEGLVIPRGGGLIRFDCQRRNITPPLRSLVKLYAMVGLHRYNMVKGTSFFLHSLLKFNKLTNCVSSYYITLIAYDPKSRDLQETFQVRIDEKTRGNLDMTCSVARPKDEKGDLTKKKKPFSAHYHGGALAKNVIFKGGLPDWPSDLDLSNTKRFYMVTKQEWQDSNWIFFYLQLVICAEDRFVDETVLDELQIVKVAIETGEDNDERLNAKSAIVYITFMGLVNGKPAECKAIVRRVLNVNGERLSLMGQLCGGVRLCLEKQVEILRHKRARMINN
ncbi:hypothetical protein V5N11_020486 [Cardamine amara subsp. amara]|uniref:Uncharacterized protein n=1 Tax=Cardamine amara subsp. amara TaxID=228776 RepID=A0ABD1BD97_CARAN